MDFNHMIKKKIIEWNCKVVWPNSLWSPQSSQITPKKPLAMLYMVATKETTIEELRGSPSNKDNCIYCG